mgnify:FL=1
MGWRQFTEKKGAKVFRYSPFCEIMSVQEAWVQPGAGDTCWLCGRLARMFLCRACSEGLAAYRRERGRSTFQGRPIFFAAPHGGLFREKMLDFKFRRKHSLGKGMAYLMAQSWLEGAGVLPDLLVPVPQGPWKEKQRGFSPSQRLAWELSGIIGVPVSQSLSKKDTRALSLIRGNREALLSETMTWKGRERDCRLLVIDDVWTTGATMREAFRALEAAGFQALSFLAFGRREGKGRTDIWFPHWRGL